MGDFLGCLGLIYFAVLLFVWTMRIGLFLCCLTLWLCYLPFGLVLGLNCEIPKEIGQLVGIGSDE